MKSLSDLFSNSGNTTSTVSVSSGYSSGGVIVNGVVAPQLRGDNTFYQSTNVCSISLSNGNTIKQGGARDLMDIVSPDLSVIDTIGFGADGLEDNWSVVAIGQNDAGLCCFLTVQYSVTATAHSTIGVCIRSGVDGAFVAHDTFVMSGDRLSEAKNSILTRSHVQWSASRNRFVWLFHDKIHLSVLINPDTAAAESPSDLTIDAAEFGWPVVPGIHGVQGAALSNVMSTYQWSQYNLSAVTGKPKIGINLKSFFSDDMSILSETSMGYGLCVLKDAVLITRPSQSSSNESVGADYLKTGRYYARLDKADFLRWLTDVYLISGGSLE